MITSIINKGEVTTPAKLAGELVFTYGKYCVGGFKAIINAHDIKLTIKEREKVIEQLTNMLRRSANTFKSSVQPFSEEDSTKAVECIKAQYQ